MVPWPCLFYDQLYRNKRLINVTKIYIYIYTLYIVLRTYIFQSDLLMTNAEMIAASIMKQSAFPAREGRFHCCNDCTGNTYRKTHATYTYIPITMDTSRTFSWINRRLLYRTSVLFSLRFAHATARKASLPVLNSFLPRAIRTDYRALFDKR